MGRVFRPPTPKPPAPVVRYVSTPTPAADPSPSTPVVDPDVLDSEARKASLLRRSRGSLGTIATSFRGFLDPIEAQNSAPRKTLLGE